MCFALLLQLLLILKLEMRTETRIKYQLLLPDFNENYTKKFNKALQYQNNEKYL